MVLRLGRPKQSQLRRMTWQEPSLDAAALAKEIRQLQSGVKLVAQEIKQLEETLADKRHMQRRLLSALGARINADGGQT